MENRRQPEAISLGKLSKCCRLYLFICLFTWFALYVCRYLWVFVYFVFCILYFVQAALHRQLEIVRCIIRAMEHFLVCVLNNLESKIIGRVFYNATNGRSFVRSFDSIVATNATVTVAHHKHQWQ